LKVPVHGGLEIANKSDNMNVEMPEHVYRAFLKFVLEHARPDRRYDWKEVIGFLFGKFEGNQTVITDVKVCNPGETTFVKVADYSFISGLMTEKLENEEYIIGWIHSHPGFGLFLSSTDVETQLLYEMMDNRAIAIVMDPTLIPRGGGQSGSGAGAFKLADDRGYTEIKLNIQGIDDFNAVYTEITGELSAIEKTGYERVVTIDMDPQPLIDTGNINFYMESPDKVKCGTEFRIMLRYRIIEPSHGRIALNFSLHLQNAYTVTRHWKKYFTSFIPSKKGTIAVFTMRATNNVGEKVEIRIKDLQSVDNGNDVPLGDITRTIDVL